jgi:hypothetical protein
VTSPDLHERGKHAYCSGCQKEQYSENPGEKGYHYSKSGYDSKTEIFVFYFLQDMMYVVSNGYGR